MIETKDLRVIDLLNRHQLGGFVLVTPACGIGFKDALYFAPHTAKDRELILVRALRFGRIVKSPVVTVHLAWEHGTGLIGVPADGDDSLDLFFTKKFIHML